MQAGEDTVQSVPAGTLAGASSKWTDSLIKDYISHSSTFAHEADKDSLVYFLDRRENTDSARYLVYQLGHSTENRFSTDQWLYIDSLTRTIYEYDVVDDKLVKWKK